MPSIGHQALRKGRISQPWRIYHVTTVTAGRKPVFAQPHVAQAACHCFENAVLLRDAQMLAWVLMPDHAHWLIALGEDRSLQQLVDVLKTFSARNANRVLGRSGRVWAPAYYDRALRSDEQIPIVVRYIAANPVRAGLVQHANDYPYQNTARL
jgi:REP element-mobilizing transposase RayT